MWDLFCVCHVIDRAFIVYYWFKMANYGLGMDSNIIFGMYVDFAFFLLLTLYLSQKYFKNTKIQDTFPDHLKHNISNLWEYENWNLWKVCATKRLDFWISKWCIFETLKLWNSDTPKCFWYFGTLEFRNFGTSELWKVFNVET